MSKQPEALRLADLFDRFEKSSHLFDDGRPLHVVAAAELRRLHEVKKELVAVLSDARHWHNGDKWRHGDADERLAWQIQRDRIDAAIAKATGEQP